MVNFINGMEKGMDFLHRNGAFLTSKADDKVNTMVISWGNIGFEWGKPVFTVLVRKSRYTREFIEKSGEFTVSIPTNNNLKEALSICGTKSGRNMDKIKKCNLQLKKSTEVSTPLIGGCNVYYECRVIYKQELNPALMSANIIEKCYSDSDSNYHTFYFGEIVACHVE